VGATDAERTNRLMKRPEYGSCGHHSKVALQQAGEAVTNYPELFQAGLSEPHTETKTPGDKRFIINKGSLYLSAPCTS